jgi:hypothetical protein
MCDVRGLPADAVLLHVPACAVLAVEDVIGVGDVFLEFSRDFPLSVVAFRRGRGYKSAGCDFLRVSEDLLAPPLQFAVWCWRETADEGT